MVAQANSASAENNAHRGTELARLTFCELWGYEDASVSRLISAKESQDRCEESLNSATPYAVWWLCAAEKGKHSIQ